MRKFIGYFKDFHKNYFNLLLYVVIGLFIAALIAFNYVFDFEDSCIDKFYGKPIRIFFYFAIHSVAYFGVLFLIWVHDKRKIKFTTSFWVKSIIGLIILGTDRAIFPFVSKLLLSNVPQPTFRFYYKVLFNLYGVLTVFFTLFLVKQFFDRKSGEGIYGLRFKKVEIGAYLLLLLIMVPIVYMATYLPDFLDYYPTYKRAGGARFASYYGFSEGISKLIYESAYLFDFLNTEIFFRGFLIIGMSKLLGKNAVLPMVATYAVLHFGKPMGETISSVFGGYILGIIALYSRNIWGGVFIHGGIAFLMEVFALMRQ